MRTAVMDLVSYNAVCKGGCSLESRTQLLPALRPRAYSQAELGETVTDMEWLISRVHEI
jgi:hypothetical protein